MTTIQEEFEQQKETLHNNNDIPMEHKIRAIFDNIMNELEPGVDQTNSFLTDLLLPLIMTINFLIAN